MGACCTSNAGDAPEINSTKPSTVAAKDDQQNAHEAATKVQAYYRGVMTRRVIKEEYGFEATTMNDMARGLNGQTDANVAEARRLVMQIRASLEPFKYDPAREDEDRLRETKKMIQLENGAEYEGQWDKQGRKDGRGV